MDKATLRRLLHLYPVDVLRERWEVKAQSKDALIEQVISTLGDDEIFEFSRDFHGLTKQRVMLFRNHSSTFKAIGETLIDDAVPTFSKRSKRSIEQFFLLPVVYTAIVGRVGEPYKPTKLEFLWPISIVVDSTFARLNFTIIEKNIDAYLSDGFNAYDVRKEYDEKAICNRFIGGTLKPDVFEAADLNRGVKSLWNNDQIDALYNAAKTSCSTHTETMDVQKLMKRDLPDAFAQAMKEPLLKTVFRTLLPEGTYPPFFTINPSEGWLTISRYPKTSIEVDNVVRAILEAN